MSTSIRSEGDGSTSPPLVSVIMATHNCEATVDASVDSIVSQTYPDWELVVCDDGSTDSTVERLRAAGRRIGPDRFVLLVNSTNRKLAYSLNRCLTSASGGLIARMDGDDLSEPGRLERQVRYLSEHPDVDLVGTSMRRFNENGQGEVVHPAASEPDRWTLGKSSKAPFLHATIMARRSVYDRVGGYTVSWRTERGQDLDLWFKFFAAGLVGRNIPDPLYLVREDAAAIRRRTAKVRLGGYVTRIRGNWSLGYPPRAYLNATVNLMKVFVPYRLFDLHRRWSRRKSDGNAKGPLGS